MWLIHFQIVTPGFLPQPLEENGSLPQNLYPPVSTVKLSSSEGVTPTVKFNGAADRPGDGNAPLFGHVPAPGSLFLRL